MMTNIFFSMLLGAVCASGWWALVVFSNTDFSFFPVVFVGTVTSTIGVAIITIGTIVEGASQ